MRVQVQHPNNPDEVADVSLPDDHDGSRVKVEFPDGAITYIEGFDPASLSDAPELGPGVELRVDSDTATASTD